MQAEKVIIHSFLTSGFVPWGEFFLEAVKYLYGERIRVWIDGRDLTDEDIRLLKSCYSNIEIRNEKSDYEGLAKVAGVDMKTVDRWRMETEQGTMTEENRLCKIFISVNQRYRSMEDVYERAKQTDFDLLLHCDADVYIRQGLEEVFNAMDKNQFGLFIRTNKPHRLKVLGGFLAFNLKNPPDQFVQTWMNEIDKVAFLDRWKGFGQSVIWFAYEQCKDTVSIVDFNKLSSGMKFSKKFETERALWVGNSKVKKRGPDKVVTLPLFWKDLKERLPRSGPFKQSFSERLRLAWEIIHG